MLDAPTAERIGGFAVERDEVWALRECERAIEGIHHRVDHLAEEKVADGNFIPSLLTADGAAWSDAVDAGIGNQQGPVAVETDYLGKDIFMAWKMCFESRSDDVRDTAGDIPSDVVKGGL